ncbi:calcium-binding protein [Sinorhizobium fredii]|uniref:calcium-binding protein n=1 Tax=Rhizobium fredii TaxID=380 RepID=UPI00059569EC|nr:calcium-binding protein [Sinorhizobium fredii]WOS62026.1 calcium-binding protein [Sinorhizobium fredii GR64]
MPTETIEVFYKYTDIDSAGGTPYYHKYIVYTDSNGDKWYARGGPDYFSSGHFMKLHTQYGAYIDDPSVIDWDAGMDDPSEVIKTGADLSADWDAIKAAMDDINDENWGYVPPSRNSNSAVDTALDRAGLPLPINDDPGEYLSPGSGNILPEEVQNPPVPQPKPALLEDREALWDIAPASGSPLVLDLDGDGVELTTFNAASTTTFFDIDDDGFAEQTAWVHAHDGLLVRDLNSNGKIDDVGELFGSPTVDGFALLAELDSNGDLVIDSGDANWSTLRIWKDSDGDAITDGGELLTLSSENIVSFDLVGVTPSTSTISGNAISHTSTFKYANGTTRAVADAWFVYDNVNTFSTATYTMDEAVFFLPTLRGFGQLPDLHLSMMADATLKGLVQDFQENWGFERFADPSTLNDDIADILYEWAGVAGVSPSNRGGLIDARKLEFMEEYFGEEFRQWGTNPNPWGEAAAVLERVWNELTAHLRAQLIVQAGATTLFGGSISYDVLAGELAGTFDLDEVAIDDLVAYATDTGVDTDEFWLQIADFLEHTKGLANITVTEEGWLDTAVDDSGLADTWDDIVEAYQALGSNDGMVISGDSGNNTINGTAGDDDLRGQGGADTINGGDGDDLIRSSTSSDSTGDTLNGDNGNDDIEGSNGADTITGGAGHDSYEGKQGNDTYAYTSGDDYILDYANGAGSNDKILMPAGIESGDLTFHRLGDYNLLIEVAGLGSIQVEKHFNYSSGWYSIETIQFDDTSTFNLTSMDAPISYGTEDDDQISGITVGAGANDTIYGYGGDDWIQPKAGNNRVDGGTGNDLITLANGTGSNTNTIVASAGFDEITLTNAVNKIEIPDEYSPADVTLIRRAPNTNDMYVQVVGLGQIRVTQQFYNSAPGRVSEIVFADASPSINVLTREFETWGTSGNDTFSGITDGGSTADILKGFAGNDTLSGGNGNDLLYGGDGNDSLTGGNDNDTLYGEAGDDTLTGSAGNDTYVYSGGLDSVTDSGGTDVLAITGGTTINDIIVSNYSTNDAKIVIAASTDEIVANNLRAGSSNHVETIQFDDGFSANLPSYNSWIKGTSGADTVSGNSSDNVLIGYADNDTINSGSGNDNAHGGSGNDTLHGDGGTDLLHGGVGNDVLYGDDGLDTLYGGSGADTFMLEATEAFANVDVIKDLNIANDNDVLDISDILDATPYNHGVDLITNYVEITTSGSDSVVKIDRDGAGGTYTMTQVATLQGVTGLTDEAALVTSGNLIAA